MRFTRYAAGLLLVALMLAAPPLAPAASYDEGVNGDLSGAVGAPTPWALNSGANTLTATSGGGDFDLLALTIPVGLQLDSITLNSYSGPTQSFTGIESGGTWSAGLGGAVNPAVLLGWSHFGPASSAGVGTDILDNISTGAGAIGFTPPLGSGTYSMLLQDTGGAVNYSMTFNVSPVPEPSSLVLLLLATGLGAFWLRRRR